MDSFSSNWRGNNYWAAALLAYVGGEKVVSLREGQCEAIERLGEGDDALAQMVWNEVREQREQLVDSYAEDFDVELRRGGGRGGERGGGA